MSRRVTGGRGRTRRGIAAFVVERPEGILFAFLVVLCLVFGLVADGFASGANAATILASAAVLAMITIGQTVAMISGGFDLSVSGVAPLAGVLFVLMSNQHVPLVLDILIVLIVAGVIGCANGTVVAKLEINPLIVTLATLSITEGIAYLLSDGITIPLNNGGAAFLANPIPGNVPLFVPLTAIVAIVAALVLSFTTVGRRVYGVGGNRHAAWLAGIRVDLVTIGAFATCSVLAAVAGIMVASELVAGSGTVESTAALDSIAAVVIGGAALTGGEGSVAGSLLGVVIIATIGNGLELLHVSAFYQQIATGCLLLAAVAAQRVRKVAVGRVGSGRGEQPRGEVEASPQEDTTNAVGSEVDLGAAREV